MATLLSISTFFRSGEHYTEFQHRTEAALVSKAVALRQEEAPDPVTAEWVARQNWAVSILTGVDAIAVKAHAMIPALAVIADGLGLLDDDGVLTATDEQITAAITDAFIDMHAGYVPEAA
jgi:hypothetical protein